MWLEDFQRGLTILKYVERGLKFEGNYCSLKCKFMNDLTIQCILFNCGLYVSTGEVEKVVNRLSVCKELFGDGSEITK